MCFTILLHHYFVLVPPDDSLMCKPEFTRKLQDLIVNDGDQLQLTCTIKGDPEPQVNWTKNGQVCTLNVVVTEVTVQCIIVHSEFKFNLLLLFQNI